MPELSAKLEAERGVENTRLRSHGFFAKQGSHIKKALMVSEQARADIVQARRVWINQRQPRMRLEPHRLVFIDETSTTTKMTRRRGRAPRGERLHASAPFGHWQTQTFIAGLRCWGLTAPWVIDRPMNRGAFDTYVETQLTPTLNNGDVVILDNSRPHKSDRAAKSLKGKKAWFLFLPSYSPDLNPIEMAFAKLKALLRAAGARSYDAVWRTIGDICNLLQRDECWNFFKAAGYAPK